MSCRSAAASFVVLAVGAVALHGSQTTKLGRPASPDATSADVLVLQQVDQSSGQAFGTMPSLLAAELHRRLQGVAEFAIVGWAGSGVPLAKDKTGAPQISSAQATFNIFSVLGVRPALGRGFTEADVLDGHPVAILSAGAAELYFDKPSDAIGATLWSVPPNRPAELVIVVGVLGRGALTATPELDAMTEAFVLTDHRFPGARPDDRCPAGILRLLPGVSLATAQRAIDEGAAAVRPRLGDATRDLGARLSTLRPK